ncbi:MAG: LD-carboxypeptidase [Candidatus Pacebacteria bacterium]|nr:LD-carboxypeptidase [Candidatus Paceibacterota bacterium]
MKKLRKLEKGDKVAILSPSFAAAGKWPQVYELGLERMRSIFGLEPVEFPTTKKLGASKEERAADLVAAFEREDIRAVIATLGGDDQVTYIKNLPPEPFKNNPKPFFGFSDNTHFANFLWLQGVPSYYGGCLFTQFAMQKRMDAFTVDFLSKALFEDGEYELRASETFNDIGLDWNDPSTLTQSRTYEPNEGWQWDGVGVVEGVTWGGCLESIDEILRHGVALPTLESFDDSILMTETSEEIPSHGYVRRVYRALGERGILARVRGVVVGRPQAYTFEQPHTLEEKGAYRAKQRETIIATVRAYNSSAPIVLNMDFGHTNPQIPMPYGGLVRIDADRRKVSARF